ncbi:DUF6527 family protein [Pseudonocardia charpentierae]|uniref:DUF6527 family protein n=1 Tax=Pseudonocardia charpentierae TaxID=3075545 RepID=UPI0037C95417
MQYATAVHLCACGCGFKVVTPLGRGGWRLTFDGAVSLHPSVGNGQSRCRSHYVVRRNVIDWFPPISVHATRDAVWRDRIAVGAAAENVAIEPRPARRARAWRHLVRAVQGMARRRGRARPTERA